MFKNRLSKFLSQCGVASRRKCEELIFEKRVSVNGFIVTSPQMIVDSKKDTICLDQQKLKYSNKKTYYVLNKPRGYVCSANSKMHKRIVLDLFKNEKGLFTVGRLDKDTTGLLIVTNDGQLAHKVMHPSFEIKKEYLVKVANEIKSSHLKTISSGLLIENTFVVPKRVEKVRKGTLKIVIAEGKKREVRKLVENADLEIKELCRIRIGNYSLGNLPVGAYKEVQQSELDCLFT